MFEPNQEYVRAVAQAACGSERVSKVKYELPMSELGAWRVCH